MRKAINDNPMVQLAVIGVLLVGVGLLVATRVMTANEKPEPESTSSASTAAAGTPADPSGIAPPSGSVGAPGGASASSSAAPVAPTSVSADALKPGPGLPAGVVDAWKSGDAVVLLVVRGGGVDDRLVYGSVQGLSSDSRVSVFVARAKDVARYSRITQGVGLSRVPALVVVRPKRLSGQVPQAQVSYGFRNSQSVVQAVHDALYKGRDDIPYYPR
jgi:hypothetical protein